MRRFWLILAILIGFCAVLKLPTLTFPHSEPDEKIFWQLAGKLLNEGRYDIQGTEVLGEVSSYIYDRPLFIHPPLFSILLMPFVAWGSPDSAVVVSWFGHFLCIIAVALIGRQMFSLMPGQQHSLIWWLPVLGMALDPFLAFLSERLWIDSLLAGLCAMAVAMFYCARFSQRRTLYLLGGGIVFGLAGLTKLPALILTPLIVLLIVTPEVERRSKLRDLFLGGLPAFVLMLPWFIVFYHTFGVLTPYWTKPDEWSMANYPLVRLAVNRSPVFYLLKLAFIQPVTVLCLGAYLFRHELWKRVDSLFPVVWFLLVLGVLSLLGMQGQGFQMRFLAPMFPAVYIMLYALLIQLRGDRDVTVMIVLLCLILAGITGALVISDDHEILSLFELSKWMRL